MTSTQVERNSQKSADAIVPLLVWDTEGAPSTTGYKTVCWQSVGSGAPDIVSIPKLVETNADALKKRYLAWVYDLGEARIRGRRLIDHLELRPGFSYWWMTLFAEKCNYVKSPHIDHAIRLMAFEDWIQGKVFGHMVVVSSNAHLAECLRSWCVATGVSFEWQPLPATAEQQSWLKKFHRALPHSLQAITWLVLYLVRRWPLKGAGLSGWRQSGGRTTFVSYLFNLVPEAASEGRFASYYWAHLPENLQRDGCKTNWLHLYVEHALLPNARKAVKAICQFNNTAQDGQKHVALDTFLSWTVVFKTLRDWFRLRRRARGLQEVLCLPHGVEIPLWPLFREDWRRSLAGKDALSNLLHCNLFESAFKSLALQRVGVYLQENQGWEFACIHAWKAAGHGRLIGTPHSTVRYWDLRYFFHPGSYTRSGNNDLPLPDQVALNGLAAFDAYRAGDYPLEDVVEVEALRYLHLSEAKKRGGVVLPESDGHLRVLVLGDYDSSYTKKQLHLFEKTAQFLPSDAIITLKPHPACPVQLSDFPGLKMQMTANPVSELLDDCDVVYTSSNTAAAVDAYCAGVPVVSLLDPSRLNLSPLRGREGVSFVSTPEELTRALISAASGPRGIFSADDFFWLDSTMPRWKNLIGVGAVNLKQGPRLSPA